MNQTNQCEINAQDDESWDDAYENYNKSSCQQSDENIVDEIMNRYFYQYLITMKLYKYKLQSFI